MQFKHPCENISSIFLGSLQTMEITKMEYFKSTSKAVGNFKAISFSETNHDETSLQKYR